MQAGKIAKGQKTRAPIEPDMDQPQTMYLN